MDTVGGGRGSKAAVLTIADRATRLMATTKLGNLSQNVTKCCYQRLCKTNGELSESGSNSNG